MCAQIYQKPSDNTLLLDPREAIQRPFDFTGAWTEIRLGIYVAAVSGSDVAGADETATINSANDYLCFGIKNSSNQVIPGLSGSIFLGVGAYDGAVNKISNQMRKNGTTFNYCFGTRGNTAPDLAFPAEQKPFGYQVDPSTSDNYNGFYGLKIVVVNRGLATQNIIFSSVVNASVAAPYTTDALVASLNTFASPQATSNLTWNNGSTAYEIPDAFYLHCPLFNNQFRVSAMYVKRYA